MPGRGRPKSLVVEDRRRQVAALHLKGVPQVAIAKTFSVHRAQINRDLDAIRADWVRQRILDVGQRNAIDLAKLDLVEAEAWAAWDRSKLDAERVTDEKIKGAKGTDPEKATGEHRVVTQTEGRLPSAEYLKIIVACIAKRREILGLPAPPTTPGVAVQVNVGTEVGWNGREIAARVFADSGAAELAVALVERLSARGLEPGGPGPGLDGPPLVDGPSHNGYHEKVD